MVSDNDPEGRRRHRHARDAALRRLRAAHEDEYRVIYLEEAAARGVKPHRTKSEQINDLRSALAELEGTTDA